MTEARRSTTTDTKSAEFRNNTAASDPAQDPDAGTATMVSGLNLLLGLWLVIAPWALDYSSQNNAVWNQVVIGIAIAVIALVRVMAPVQTASWSWVNAVLGAWLIIAPFVLAYNDTGRETTILWNDVIVGVLVLGLAVWSALAGSRAQR